MKNVLMIVALAAFALLAGGCSPEVGSPEWCKAMKEKPKGEWTATELKEYTKNCIM